jgi:hypothetical protein
MLYDVHIVRKSSLVEDAGLAPGRAQRAAVPWGRRRRQEFAPATPGEEAAAVGALPLHSGEKMPLSTAHVTVQKHDLLHSHMRRTLFSLEHGLSAQVP